MRSYRIAALGQIPERGTRELCQRARHRSQIGERRIALRQSAQ
jgi:hypothetical protein